MLMYRKLPHKRGDTFSLKGVVRMAAPEDGPTDITDWGIRCDIRKGAALVASPVVSKDDPLKGEYSLLTEDTTDWPIGTLEMDVKYTLPNGHIISTATVAVEVAKDITQ